MKTMTKSLKIYIGLVITLAIFAGLNIFLPQGDFLPAKDLPASKPVLALVNALTMLILYGGLGVLGFKLAPKAGIIDIWDEHVNNRQRFFIPLLLGIASGVFLIVADTIFKQFHNLGPLPHPPFPASIVASIVAGIGEEIIFRLFFISFWVWLISSVFLKNKWQQPVFWGVSILSALLFAGGHIPAVMMIVRLTSINEIPLSMIIEIFLLNSVVAVLAAYYFRKYGFLAAVGIHFWTDIVWHVIWGSLSQVV